ncbi:hypothetical protein GPECTOR_4g1011 [Gonium pectorale]|uniref:Uncharacterized protein n=1 Tax=Gonium pectorale TaxID=33097 RepID=A0A150GYQ7_GONPE|nr:hypothetical protein GPECTOR_4g1011 [Gonium pectorale]|eukprot:KXZ54460.1 hypothetical protein GPECTOR_4g1011 [Gonium pectorale]
MWGLAHWGVKEEGDFETDCVVGLGRIDALTLSDDDEGEPGDGGPARPRCRRACQYGYASCAPPHHAWASAAVLAVSAAGAAAAAGLGSRSGDSPRAAEDGYLGAPTAAAAAASAAEGPAAAVLSAHVAAALAGGSQEEGEHNSDDGLPPSERAFSAAGLEPPTGRPPFRSPGTTPRPDLEPQLEPALELGRPRCSSGRGIGLGRSGLSGATPRGPARPPRVCELGYCGTIPIGAEAAAVPARWELPFVGPRAPPDVEQRPSGEGAEGVAADGDRASGFFGKSVAVGLTSLLDTVVDGRVCGGQQNQQAEEEGAAPAAAEPRACGGDGGGGRSARPRAHGGAGRLGRRLFGCFAWGVGADA